MPKGIREFRWIETGHKVWMLEDSPRHFHGVVMAIAGGLFVWRVSSSKQSGECNTKRESMAAVESRVIPATKKARLTVPKPVIPTAGDDGSQGSILLPQPADEIIAAATHRLSCRILELEATTARLLAACEAALSVMHQPNCHDHKLDTVLDQVATAIAAARGQQ